MKMLWMTLSGLVFISSLAFAQPGPQTIPSSKILSNCVDPGDPRNNLTAYGTIPDKGDSIALQRNYEGTHSQYVAPIYLLDVANHYAATFGFLKIKEVRYITNNDKATHSTNDTSEMNEEIIHHPYGRIGNITNIIALLDDGSEIELNLARPSKYTFRSDGNVVRTVSRDQSGTLHDVDGRGAELIGDKLASNLRSFANQLAMRIQLYFEPNEKAEADLALSLKQCDQQIAGQADARRAQDRARAVQEAADQREAARQAVIDAAAARRADREEAIRVAAWRKRPAGARDGVCRPQCESQGQMCQTSKNNHNSAVFSSGALTAAGPFGGLLFDNRNCAGDAQICYDSCMDEGP